LNVEVQRLNEILSQANNALEKNIMSRVNESLNELKDNSRNSYRSIKATNDFQKIIASIICGVVIITSVVLIIENLPRKEKEKATEIEIQQKQETKSLKKDLKK
jgi:hypothetical protein